MTYFLLGGLMRASFIMILIFLLFVSVLSGIDVINNPEKPINPRAGYHLDLEERMRIIETASDFYFRYVIDVKIGSDGSIFILDQRELLKFDSNGTFITNFYKHGQGPGEATYISNFLVKGKNLIVFDGSQSRVLIFDHETRQLIKEFKLNFIGFYELVEADTDKLFFLHRTIPDTGGKVEVFDIEMKLLSITFEEKFQKELFTFPMKYIALRAGERNFSDSRAKFLTSEAGKNFLYISHTPEYEVVLYDYEANRVVNRFTRKYTRVATTPETKKYAPGGNIGKFSIDGKQFFSVAVDEYLLDIQELVTFKNKLWVITSTVSGGNRVLVDVFDDKGRYVDNFYLQCPKDSNPYQISTWIKSVNGNYLFTAEQDEDGNLFLKKYEVKNHSLWE